MTAPAKVEQRHRDEAESMYDWCFVMDKPEECERIAQALANAEQRGREDEREELSPLVVVLRDRLFASTIYAGASVNEADHHEDASEVIVRNQEAIRKCDALDPFIRSHEKWELEAAQRLESLAAIRARGQRKEGE